MVNLNGFQAVIFQTKTGLENSYPYANDGESP